MGKKEGAFYPLGFYLFLQRVCFSMGMFFCMESMNSMGLEHGSFQQTQKEGVAFIKLVNSAFMRVTPPFFSKENPSGNDSDRSSIVHLTRQMTFTKVSRKKVPMHPSKNQVRIVIPPPFFPLSSFHNICRSK